MYRHRKTALFIALALAFSASQAAAKPKAKYPAPSYPPLKGEFYPMEGQKYPQKMTNPYAHIRDVPFEGKPIEVYLQINHVTQIQFPAPPVMVHIGRPDGFTVDTVVEFNSVFVKPIQEVEATNMIVTTDRGVYVVILKENPYLPYDVRVVVNDPYRNVNPGDTQTLVWTAYYGKRPAEFQFLPLSILSPNTAGYIYDPISRLGCRVSLQRVVCFPRSGKSVYWVRVMNVLPPQVSADVPVSSFMVDERSVWAPGIDRVVVPGTQDWGIPLLGKGNYVDMFMIVNSGVIPKNFKFRFALQGNRTLPLEVSLPTAGKSGKSDFAPVKTLDEKLAEMYRDAAKNQPVTIPGEARQAQTQPPASGGSKEAQPSASGGSKEIQPAEGEGVQEQQTGQKGGTVLYFPE